MTEFNIEQSYIAIEGMPGSGKKFLWEQLANKFNLKQIKDDYLANPFLKDFYREPDKFDLPIQLHFLINRYNQQLTIMPKDLFSQGQISNYIFAKDQIYARFNLDDKKFTLYNQILKALNQKLPTPDLTIYLSFAEADPLYYDLKEKKRPFADYISLDYLRSLNMAYNYFFENYNDSPLLIVNLEKPLYDREDFLATILAEIKGMNKETKFMKL